MNFEARSAQDFLRQQQQEKKQAEQNLNERVENLKIMEHLLSLFGTEEAKEKFLALCKDYRTSCWRQRDEEITERTLNRTQREESSEAKIHNKIMDIISNLSLSPNADIHIFSKIGDRDRVTQVIFDYINFSEEEKSKKAA